MPDNINDTLHNLNTELQHAEAKTTDDRATTLRQRLDLFINGDPDNDDWNGLRAELLEAEAHFIETHPRLASTLRSAVAIIDNAGL